MSYPISECVLYVQYTFHFKVVKGSSLGLKVYFDNMDTLRSKLQTDWDKCSLCQTKNKGEDLKSPPSGSIQQCGYSMLATNVPLFKAIDQLPIIFAQNRLDEGDGVEATLRNNQAKYHQSCRLLFKNTKLQRALIASSAFYVKKKNQSLNLDKL